MGRRSEHSRTELQQLIITATGELIDTHGVGRVTARMIAEAVQYTPGMLYSVFKNLDDIFLQVNERSLADLQKSCKRAGQTKKYPQEAILAIGHAYMEFALTRNNRFDLMFSQGKSASVPPPKHFTEKTQSLFCLIKDQLQKIKPDASDQELDIGCRSLWCGLHGAASSAVSNQPVARIWRADKPVVNSLITHYLGGWVKQ